jgi:hypothetical protein
VQEFRNLEPADKKTIMTFTAPVEIPGKALPAGTYVFKVLDPLRTAISFRCGIRTRSISMRRSWEFRIYRMMRPDKPLVQFEERPSNSPEALKAWFYPGDNYGSQFVYPHDRVGELAERTNQNVLSMYNEMAKNITAPAKSAHDSSVQALENAEVTGVNRRASRSP